MTGIFDTHAHYDEACYEKTGLDRVLQEQRENGVSLILNCSSTIPSSERSVQLAARYDMIYAAVGVLLGFDPLAAERLPEHWLARLEQLAAQPKVVCIGEIGLDYFDGKTPKSVQWSCFEKQLELAKRLNLPVELHSRMADADMLAILAEHRPAGVLHRFAGDLRFAERLMELGLSLGIGCELTYPGAEGLCRVAAQMPEQFLLLETDSPFLPPARLAGTVSTSAQLAEVAQQIAALRKDKTAQQVVDLARENGKKLFAIG